MKPMSNRLSPKTIRDDKQTRFDVHAPTGQVLKFIVTRMDKGEDRVYFLAHLASGESGSRPFHYVGMLNGWSGEVALTHQSTYPETDTVVKVARRALAALYGRQALPKGFKVERH